MLHVNMHASCSRVNPDPCGNGETMRSRGARWRSHRYGAPAWRGWWPHRTRLCHVSCGFRRGMHGKLMTAKIIDGKAVAEGVRRETAQQVAALVKSHGIQPGLAVV